jgi:aldose sugar dehydrogenase
MKLRHAFGLAAAASSLVLAACSTSAAQGTASADTKAAIAAAGPPAETRPTNKANYTPAFEGQTRAPEVKANVSYDVTPVVASGLNTPFAFEFLPGGKVLITERTLGQFRIADASGKLSAPIKDGVPAVAAQGQGGLLDVALDPNFATNQMIYWSFSEPQADRMNNTAVAKAKLVDGPTPKLENVQVIYHQSPSLASPLHFGSRLVFAKDGTLFVTQGDRSILPGRVQAEDLKSGIGKIVRINTDGSIPKDNPFVGRADVRPEIWSYGHRNVQGAFLHPATGELWELEHGPQGGDEINIAKKGKDYGWPSITYGVEYGPANTKIGEGLTQKANLEQPIYYWDPVIAPGGLAYYNSDAIKPWKGSVFAAGLNSNYVARLTVDGSKVRGEERMTFSEGKERYRDIGVGPDGALYVLTDGPAARLLKVAAKASGPSTLAPAAVPPPPAVPAVAQQSPPPPAVEPGASLLAMVTMPAKDGAKLTVSTPGWKNMEDIPFRYTQYQGNNFPGLEWSKGPAATKSYAIIMQDTDLVMRGSPILHWSVVNIPATVTKLEAGMAPDGKPASAIYGPNYQGAGKPYLGPRTPPGPKHRYHMQVLALDTMLPADFAPKNYDELIAPIKGHVVASGEVIGLGQVDPAAPPPAPRTPPATPPATTPSPN